jgi:hypothetical protein
MSFVEIKLEDLKEHILNKENWVRDHARVWLSCVSLLLEGKKIKIRMPWRYLETHTLNENDKYKFSVILADAFIEKNEIIQWRDINVKEVVSIIEKICLLGKFESRR